MLEDIKFADLFDLEQIQKIQDAFSLASSVASIITEPDGTPITKPSNFCQLCMDVIRKTEKGLSNCMKSDAIIGRQNPSGPIMRRCLSGGLWDGGAGISVGDKHIANWLIGQVRNETQNDAQMLKYADEIGANREEFASALSKVPRMSIEQFQNVCNSLFLFANQLSTLAYQNLQLREKEELLKKHNQELEIRVGERTSELAESNRKLRQAKELAETANATKDKFFCIIAHDLKNPFNYIYGITHLLISNIDTYSSEKSLQLLQIVRDSSQNAYKLLENLLEWSRSQTGNIEFLPQELVLKNVVIDIIGTAQSSSAAKNIEVSCEMDDGIRIFADKNMITTVLRNLLGNAIKFTSRNGKIQIDASQFDNTVQISVKDNGVGIKPEKIEKLFKISEKTSTSGTEGEVGTGIGLILCKEFVERHGGKIWVESEVGKGSDFKFGIPLWNPEKEQTIFVRNP